jgi:tetratricopeptide (TPR) repeat protein
MQTGARGGGRLGTVTADHTDIPYYYGLIEEYRSELAEDPDNLAANIALANALYDAGQWREAITYYDRALRLDPRNADVVTDRGTCFRNMGMADEAVAEYHRALKLDPSNQDALYNLGVVYSHDKKDLAKAILFWERLLEIAPKHPQANDIRASIENFRRALKAGTP